MSSKPGFNHTARAIFMMMAWAAPFMALAAPVTPDEAMSEALAFRTDHNSWFRKAKPAAADRITLEYTSTTAEGDCFYVFNNPGNAGFTIISADDRLPAVLGFSENGSFDINRIPDNMRWWLSQYTGEISAYLKANPETGEDSPVRRRLKKSVRYAADNEFAAISPMITTRWDQTAPYNNDCPVDTRTGRRSVTGCVATAMAQVMNYHKWPQKATGFAGGLNFEGVEFSWDNMLDEYVDNKWSAPQAQAVATLMRYCGASVNMQYSSYASGAFSNDVQVALIENFGYNPSLQYHQRDYYTQRQWNRIVYDELAAGRPVYYAGQAASGGHAFVCDGYLRDGLFHFNWGWSGYQDGWFLLNSLNPSTGGTGSFSGGYNSQQQILTGVRKANGETKRQTLLLALGNFIYDAKDNAYTISEGRDGYDLIYNPLGYTQTFNIGIKITPAAGGDPVYSMVAQRQSLQPGYGFTQFSVNLPSLANGSYHVSPVLRTTDGEYQDILVPYGKQRYVTLTISGGTPTMSNDGPGPETKSKVIASVPDFITPYEGDALAFRMTASNVLEGDYYSNLNLAFYADDDFGSLVDMGARASIPGNSSVNLEFFSDNSPKAGTYRLYFFDNAYNEILPSMPFEVKKRQGAVMPAGSLELRQIAPNFLDLPGQVGVTITAYNDAEEDVTATLRVRLVRADDLSEVTTLTASQPLSFPSKREVGINFDPRSMNLEPGKYYWIGEDTNGHRLSYLMPLIVHGEPVTENGITYRVTDARAHTARVVGVQEGMTTVDIPDQINGNDVTSLAADLFTFNPVANNVTLPTGVKELQPGIFYNTRSLIYLNMMSPTPPTAYPETFSDAVRSHVTVSGPGADTRLYHDDSYWAPFNMSNWDLSFGDGVSYVSGLEPAGSSTWYQPYWFAARDNLRFMASAPEGRAIRAAVTIDGRTQYIDMWREIILPPLRGKKGSAVFTHVDGTGVGEINADGTLADVYSIDGVLVKRNATSEQISELPAGVYISGGRKIIVR